MSVGEQALIQRIEKLENIANKLQGEHITLTQKITKLEKILKRVKSNTTNNSFAVTAISKFK